MHAYEPRSVVEKPLPEGWEDPNFFHHGGHKVQNLVVGLHVIVICLHVLHVNVVTYVIFLLHTGEFTCKIIYM